jgi:hypothetical protein
MTVLLPLLLLVAQPAALLGVQAEEHPGTATVHVLVTGPYTHTTRHWTDRFHTLVVDLQGAVTAVRPGTAFTGKSIRVRIGQFQARTARVVIESTYPFAYSTAKQQDALLVQLRFPGAARPARPAATATPAAPPPPAPAARPSPAATPAPQPAAGRTFSIVAFGSLESIAQTIAAISGTPIRVHPAVAQKPAALKLESATLQQALAELARQTGARWTRNSDGTIDILPR